MRTQDVAIMLCEMEGKKEQVNIAQMNEIAKILPKLVLRNKNKLHELMEFLFREFEDFNTDARIDFLNGEFNAFTLYVDRREDVK